MLKSLKRLKNNRGGYVLVYVILLMGFITILFAGMATMLNGRAKMAGHNVSSQQLQLTAQSALGTIVDEFENNAELKAKLAEYVQGSGQTAQFELTNDTGITDDITVKITKAEGEENKARIQVEARNEANTNSVSIAYAIVDYSEPPKGESAGVVDNLIVAFMPEGTYSGDTKINRKQLLGKAIFNNYGKNEIVFENTESGIALGSVITSGDVHFASGKYVPMSEDADGKIASIGGKVIIDGQARMTDKSVNLIAAKKGYEQRTNNHKWENPELKIVTGDGGNVNIQALVGEIGSIVSGGKMEIKHWETDNLTINGDVIGTKDVSFVKSGDNNKLTTIKGNLISGEDLDLKVNNRTTVIGDIAAVGSIEGGNESSWITAANVYAGRDIEFEHLNSFDTANLLSGANYRNGDGDNTKNSYVTKSSNEGGITLRGSNIKFARAIINDADGEKNIDNPTGTIYKRGENSDFEDKFFSVNGSWRNLMFQVERGADSKGYVNLATALRPSEVNAADKLEAFTNTMEPAGGYYVNKDGTYVSHHSKYTVDKSKYVLNSTIKSTFDEFEEEFKQSIPDMTKTPDVVIPDSLKTRWARVTCNGSDEVVINEGGYIQVTCWNTGGNLKLTAIDSNSGEIATFDLNCGADVVFDTTNGKSYDMLVGTKPIEEYALNTGTCYFPFDIHVNQPKVNPGFVRFFIPEEQTFWLGVDGGANCMIKNIGDSAEDGIIPEIYWLYNGTKDLKLKGRMARGFIIAPHCVIDFDLAYHDWVENKLFEGLMICGNIRTPGNMECAKLVYYKPLTHEKALTTDIYKYNS